VFESIQRYCDRGARAVYLGAGLGRLAFEGGKHFSSVIAAELSFACAALFMAVRAGPVDFCWVNWKGAASERELVEVYRAAFPSENYGANIDYVIADALSLPIPDASLEAVVSIFFTDAIPLSRLLPEVRRVLRPGGRFISVGPLFYLFEDKAQWLTQEEVRFVVETTHEMAFESGDNVFEVPYMCHPGCIRMAYRVWSFVATRR
jgi:SAM-dependent methyltransferase